MHPPRLAGFSYQGLHPYFLTFCVFPRRPVFIAEAVVQAVLRHFRQSAAAERIELTAYCFMPDHLHLLGTPASESSDLRRLVADAKQRSGYGFAKEHGQSLWQKGYYDHHVLRDDEDLLPVVRYIVGNPLRAGIASAIGEYPYCGSDRYSMTQLAESVQMWTPPWKKATLKGRPTSERRRQP